MIKILKEHFDLIFLIWWSTYESSMNLEKLCIDSLHIKVYFFQDCFGCGISSSLASVNYEKCVLICIRKRDGTARVMRKRFWLKKELLTESSRYFQKDVLSGDARAFSPSIHCIIMRQVRLYFRGYCLAVNQAIGRVTRRCHDNNLKGIR